VQKLKAKVKNDFYLIIGTLKVSLRVLVFVSFNVIVRSITILVTLVINSLFAQFKGLNPDSDPFLQKVENVPVLLSVVHRSKELVFLMNILAMSDLTSPENLQIIETVRPAILNVASERQL
jgi:hypothetical protein